MNDDLDLVKQAADIADELERLNAKANPGDGQDWLQACEDLGEFYAANTRRLVKILRALTAERDAAWGAGRDAAAEFVQQYFGGDDRCAAAIRALATSKPK